MSKTENQPSKGIGKNVDKPLLTVKEVATLIGESVHILRNWLKELKTYLPLQKNEAGYNLFNEEAVEMVRTIQRLHRENGYSMKQIEHYFATGGKDFIPVTAPMVEEQLAKDLQDMKELMQSMADQLEKQEEFNRALVQKLDEQQKRFETLLSERDRQLLNVMQDMEKKTLELAAAHEEKKKPWWKPW